MQSVSQCPWLLAEVLRWCPIPVVMSLVGPSGHARGDEARDPSGEAGQHAGRCHDGWVRSDQGEIDGRATGGLEEGTVAPRVALEEVVPRLTDCVGWT